MQQVDVTTQPICFDMDGVILEGPGTPAAVYAHAADDALAALDPVVEPSEETIEVLRTHRYTDDFECHCDQIGIDPRTFWRLKDEYASRRAHERIESGTRGSYDDVAAIRDLVADRPTALVSNNRQATVEFVADHLDLSFDVCRGRPPTPEGYDRRKPRPDFIDETLDRLGVDGGYYVGDRPTDVEAATRAGLDPVFLRRSHNQETALPDRTVYEIESLAELQALE